MARSAKLRGVEKKIVLLGILDSFMRCSLLAPMLHLIVSRHTRPRQAVEGAELEVAEPFDLRSLVMETLTLAALQARSTATTRGCPGCVGCAMELLLADVEFPSFTSVRCCT